jgi:hypothetical protein
LGLWCGAPSLSHVEGWRLEEGRADCSPISEVKVRELGAGDFQCISTATVPMPERR